MTKMKEPLVIDIQYIFDAEGEVWSGSKQFEKSQNEILKSLGGEAFVLLKSVQSDNYAKYVFFVRKIEGEDMTKKKQPKLNQPKEIKVKNKQ